MANKKFWLGILVITLVLGMTFFGCDDGSNDNDSGTDSAVNGTWIAAGENGLNIAKLKLDKGEFQIFDPSASNTALLKGTYTTKDGTVTIKTTHYYTQVASSDPKWYTSSELRAAVAALPDYLTPEELAAFDAYLPEIFIELQCNYSVDGQTLTITVDGASFAFQKE